MKYIYIVEKARDLDPNDDKLNNRSASATARQRCEAFVQVMTVK